MNFQQTPFSGQFMTTPTSPQFQSQFGILNQATPQWVIDIQEDIKSIKATVGKIDKIEKIIDRMNSKVEKLENDVKQVNSKVIDIEKSNQFLSKEFDDTKKHVQTTNNEIKRLNKQCQELEGTIETLKTQNQTLEDKTNDLESRSMRENLLFHGIKETEGEDCELLVKTFIQETLEIQEEIVIDRAHRIPPGKPKNSGTRPLVAKFHYFKQRELIRNKAFEKANTLRNAKVGVSVQQTKATMQKRREKSALYDREKEAGRTVKWAGSRLMVRNGTTGTFREVTS